MSAAPQWDEADLVALQSDLLRFARIQTGNDTAAEDLARLWQKPAQEIGAKLYLRPADPAVLAAHAAELPPLETFDPNAVFGSWDKIMAEHFADGGLFDQLAERDK